MMITCDPSYYTICTYVYMLRNIKKYMLRNIKKYMLRNVCCFQCFKTINLRKMFYLRSKRYSRKYATLTER